MESGKDLKSAAPIAHQPVANQPVSNQPLRREGIVMCLVGPAGSGKTSLGADLLTRSPGTIKYSISATTRAPRAGEVDGVHYRFLSREEFLRRKEAHEFFETEEVHGNLYGTLRQTVQEALDNGMDLLLDVDIKGALVFKHKLPMNTVIVFLSPPSREVLIERILGRGQIAQEELERRLATATAEYARLLEHSKFGGSIDYLVLNDDRECALNRLCAILTCERMRASRVSLDEKKDLYRE